MAKVIVVGEHGERVPLSGVTDYAVLASGVLKVVTKNGIAMSVTTHYAPAAWVSVEVEGVVSSSSVMPQMPTIPVPPGR